MSKEIISAEENAAATLALEECENRIRTACRRGIEATRAIGKELWKIKNHDLYKVRWALFSDYVTEDLRLDTTSANRMIDIYDVMQRLEGADIEQLPENESQAFELSKLDPERQPLVWKKVLISCEQDDKPVTVAKVKIAVEGEEKKLAAAKQAKRPPAAPPAKPKGVEVGLNLDSGNGEDTPAPETIGLTEQGEAALARVRRLCGDEVADAILYKRVTISERELRLWAEQDDIRVNNLSHYICNLNWTVNKALNYEDRMIDGGTLVDTLITMCRARGGQLHVTHDDARISVTILAST